ncbi:MAG: hypothetical protein M1546_00665 [Chloroflexi bacterium]|nr:hypothetical protein [Chloroflexota bacterium]
MKIAFITADGKTVSKHFGRAPYYLVITVEDGRVVSHEMRDKISHTHFVNSPGESIHMQALRNLYGDRCHPT